MLLISSALFFVPCNQQHDIYDNMNRGELKVILKQMKRTSYLNAFYLLQLISKKFNLAVDFDEVCFINSSFTLSIAAIYSVLYTDNTLYILTKKKHLHRIKTNGEHVIYDANYISILNTIKSFFNIEDQ